VPEAADDVVVHPPRRLHEGVADRRLDEFEELAFISEL
jgi:hypothetical protein